MYWVVDVHEYLCQHFDALLSFLNVGYAFGYLLVGLIVLRRRYYYVVVRSVFAQLSMKVYFRFGWTYRKWFLALVFGFVQDFLTMIIWLTFLVRLYVN